MSRLELLMSDRRGMGNKGRPRDFQYRMTSGECRVLLTVMPFLDP